jgi:hypothetical protein
MICSILKFSYNGLGDRGIHQGKINCVPYPSESIQIGDFFQKHILHHNYSCAHPNPHIAWKLTLTVC